VAVIGLGYVGLPLAAAFATPAACVRTAAPLQRRVIGFDINGQRLEELRQGLDRTHETSPEELQAAALLDFTSDPALLAEAPSARKDDASSSRPLSPPGGLMEQSDASLQRGRQG